jgi:hypothetical protein
MDRFWTQGYALVAMGALGLTLLASQSRADDPVLLCRNDGASPGGTEEWRLPCIGEHIYADFRFRPIDETQGEANIHVTSWGVCDESKQRIVCAVSYGANEGCFEEASYGWLEYDGYVYGAEAFCGCFDYGTSPCL